jgi:hypothetical protein
MSNVTPLRPKDATAASRARRYRRRKKAKRAKPIEPAYDGPTVTISTIEMCTIAAAVSDGSATVEQRRLADRLIMAYVRSLKRDSSVTLPE